MSQISTSRSTLSNPLTIGARAIVAQTNESHATAAKGMSNQNIVCFAKDWDEDPTSNNHIMRLLAKNNRVLWLNSLGTRRPNLRSARDLLKIFRKLASFFRGPKHIADGLWVYSPIVIPLPGNRLTAAANDLFLRVTLFVIRWFLAMRDFQLWVFIPTAGLYARRLGESLLVYYVTDEYSKFSTVNSAEAERFDHSLCEMADIVFATAQRLVDKRLPANPATYLSRHGVDHALFSTALDPATEVPADLAALRKPVIGYYGAIRDYMDFDLIERLARNHPEWSIVLIGEPLVDVARLCRYANVHLLGRRPHRQLPAYCKGMAVATVPHKVNDLTIHMNPIKLREYLSAGLPVVSVMLPEVRACSTFCVTAQNPGEFEEMVCTAIQTDSPVTRQARSDAMASETWESHVLEIGTKVMHALRAKTREGETT